MKKHNRYTEAYSNYFPVIFGSVYTKVSNRDDARDITQEVFLRLYQKFDEVDNIRKWLFIASKLVVKEYYRKQKLEDKDIDDLLNDLSLTFVNGFRDTRIIIGEVIEDMGNFKNDIEKIIFDLIAIQNYTYRQVAIELGMTRRQIEYRYGQIVEKIQQQLQKRGIKNIEDLL